MTITTAYFGIPGHAGGKVHVLRDGKAICGSHFHPKSEMQFCAHGIRLEYIECRRCRAIATPIYLKELHDALVDRLVTAPGYERHYLKMEIRKFKEMLGL